MKLLYEAYHSKYYRAVPQKFGNFHVTGFEFIPHYFPVEHICIHEAIEASNRISNGCYFVFKVAENLFSWVPADINGKVRGDDVVKAFNNVPA
jgi:hypothetical protein